MFQKKQSSAPDLFVQIMKRLDLEWVRKILDEIVGIFFLTRKSKLNLNFFFYLIRKKPAFKEIVLERCRSIEENNELRPAQQRQMEKLKQKFEKKTT